MKKMKLKGLEVLVLGMLLLLPFATAVPLNNTITDDDKSTFNDILTPVMKLYNFVKYVASAIAVIFILFAAISFMTAGNDPKKKDSAKMQIAGVLVGLFIIWAAPAIVQYLIPTY